MPKQYFNSVYKSKELKILEYYSKDNSTLPNINIQKTKRHTKKNANKYIKKNKGLTQKQEPQPTEIHKEEPIPPKYVIMD